MSDTSKCGSKHDKHCGGDNFHDESCCGDNLHEYNAGDSRDMFYPVSIGSKRYFKSSNLTLPHLFTTRDGGYGTFDDDKLVKVRQKHTADVIYVPSDTPGGVIGEGDALVTCGFSPLCIKTADCVPILLCDSDAGIVGAAHAGWRGTVAGIASETVAAMIRLGGRPENMQVAIGAAINRCCYEVKEDFHDALAAAAGSDAAKKFIHNKDGGMCADIIGLNLMFLTKAGIKAENISVSRLCTCCDPRLFYSNRAEGGVFGFMHAIISR